MRRIVSDEGRFYSLADSQQEHLRADLSRTLHTPLHLPQYHQYGNFNSGRHDTAHVITTVACFSSRLPQAVTSPSHLLPSRYSISTPSSPEVFRKALATLCLSSRGTCKKRNTNNLRVTFADEIHVEGKNLPVYSNPEERSPSPNSSQPPKSVLKTAIDVHRILRDQGDSFKDNPHPFEQIPEEEEWRYFTDGSEAYPGSAPGSPNVFSPTTRIPSLGLSPPVRPDNLLERELRRASDTDAFSCRKELFGVEEDLRRGSTGSIQALERPSSLDVASHRPVTDSASYSREQKALQNLGPEYNYATYPAAMSYALSSVRDVSVVPKDQPRVQQQNLVSPVSATTPSEEMYGVHPSYLTFPPMNLSAYGWTQTFARPAHEKHHNDAASVASWASQRSEVCAEKGSSNGSLSYPSNPSGYTSGSSGGSWSFVTHGDHQAGHSPGQAPGYPCEAEHAPSAPVDHEQGNGHRSLPLPSVTDFMLQRYLGEVNRMFQTYPAQPSSKLTSENTSNDSRGNNVHRPTPQHPSVPPSTPLPADILPPDMRGNSVSFAPLGRYLHDLLNTCGGNNSFQGHHGDKNPSIYMAKFMNCTSFASSEDSWRALTDMVKFQSQFYNHPQPHLHPQDARPTVSPSSGYPASFWSSDRGGDSVAAGSEEIHSTSNGHSQKLSSRQHEQSGINSHSVCTGSCGQNGQWTGTNGGGGHVLKPPEIPEYAQSEPGDTQDVSKLVDMEYGEMRPRSFSTVESSTSWPGQESSVGNGSNEHSRQTNGPSSLSGPQNHGSRSHSSQNQASRSQGSMPRSHMSNSEGQASCPYIPLQLGSSDEVAADFLVFCAVVKAAFTPPPNSQNPNCAPNAPPGFPFPDFNPNWFRFLPGFPK
ncbi:uncharacterized protein [Littorina saxatilis]|uniref:Uncharacterized protein n=1 Tax=Littorina saxatilis TaxID=31220 RepID=A0AAN9C0P2_9CAEN